MSPHTLACLSLLAISFLGARLGVGLLAAATRPTAGGAAVRVLLPVAWVLPVLLGWLRLAAQRRGVFTATHVGVATFAVAQTLTLAALIAWLAPRLDALDARLADERRRRRDLESFVAMCAWTGRIRWRGEWVSVERYLAERFGLEVTHGISAGAAARSGRRLAARPRGRTRRRTAPGVRRARVGAPSGTTLCIGRLFVNGWAFPGSGSSLDPPQRPSCPRW